jgi:hypothetical protein
MKQNKDPKCESVFDGDRCELVAGDYGKHRSNHDSAGNPQSVYWTDAGLARVLLEQQKVLN